MKASTSIYLTALFLSIPLPIFCVEFIKDTEISQVLSGKLAYLESNYQKAFTCLASDNVNVLDNKTYWQLCHSAFMSKQAGALAQKIQSSNILARSNLLAYTEIWRAYEGKTPINDQQANSVSKSEWATMMGCVPKEQRLEFLDNLYSYDWLQYPSVRAFMLEQLFEWGLPDDAYELAMLNFSRVNEQWLKSCEQNFTYAQLKPFFKKDNTTGSPVAMMQWYEQSIAAYSGENATLYDLAEKIVQANLSSDACFQLACCFIRHDAWDAAQLLEDHLMLSGDQRLCLDLEKALASQDTEYAKSLINQLSSDCKDKMLYKAKVSYQSKKFAQALQYCQALSHIEKTQEAITLQAFCISWVEPDKALPYMMDQYRKNLVSHREIAAVQAHLFAVKREYSQAQSVWMLLVNQEKSELKNIAHYLDLNGTQSP